MTKLVIILFLLLSIPAFAQTVVIDETPILNKTDIAANTTFTSPAVTIATNKTYVGVEFDPKQWPTSPTTLITVNTYISTDGVVFIWKEAAVLVGSFALKTQPPSVAIYDPLTVGIPRQVKVLITPSAPVKITASIIANNIKTK